MKAQSMTLKERDSKFNWIKGLGYGLAFGNNILAGYFVTFITFFCTNSLFITAAAVGTITAISTLADGVSDLAAGYILDRTHTKWGKARPYLLFGILLWIPLILIFCAPNGSQTMKLIWVFIFFTVQKSVFQTMYSICFTPLLKRIVVDEESRLKTISFQTIFQTAVGMALGVIMPIIIAKAGSDQKLWIMTAVVLGIIGSSMSLFAFFTCKEYTEEELVELGETLADEGKNKTTIRGMFKAISGNKYFIMYLVIYGMISLINAISSVSGTYYFTVNVGNLPLMSLVTLLSFLLYPLYVVYPKIVSKIGINKFLYITGSLTTLGIAIRMFSGTNTVGIMAGSLLGGFNGAVAYVLPIIVLKCMEYGEIKLGVPTEGAYSAAQGFLYKVVSAGGSALLGFILTLGHYDGSLAAQPESAYTAINFVYNIFPIIAFILIMAFARFSNPSNEIDELKNKD